MAGVILFQCFLIFIVIIIFFNDSPCGRLRDSTVCCDITHWKRILGRLQLPYDLCFNFSSNFIMTTTFALSLQMTDLFKLFYVSIVEQYWVLIFCRRTWSYASRNPIKLRIFLFCWISLFLQLQKINYFKLTYK